MKTRPPSTLTGKVFRLSQTGARIDLSKQPVYSFTANSASLTGRFSLYFGPDNALTAFNSARKAETKRAWSTGWWRTWLLKSQ